MSGTEGSDEHIAATTLCPDCKGERIKVVNSRWPQGKNPYCELCATCSGMGEVVP